MSGDDEENGMLLNAVAIFFPFLAKRKRIP